jgi:hypothetical protein
MSRCKVFRSVLSRLWRRVYLSKRAVLKIVTAAFYRFPFLFCRSYKISLAREWHLQLSTFLGAFAKLRKAIVNFALSVCPSTWNTSTPDGWIFIKFYIWVCFGNLSRNWSLIKILQKWRILCITTYVFMHSIRYWWIDKEQSETNISIYTATNTANIYI